MRGFLAGVVRKRLKLKLGSEKVDGNRVYRIAGGDGRKSGASAARPPALSAMTRVKVGAALQDRKTLDVEIARLRDLGRASLPAWRVVFRRRAALHLPRHVLFLAFWRTGCRPFSYGRRWEWRASATYPSIGSRRDHLRTQVSVPWT